MAVPYINQYEKPPPPHARIYDPLNFASDQPFPTPVDSRGLVDVDKLIDDVIATISPDHQWSRQLRNHHIYWDAEKFKDKPGNKDNLSTFRNLPTNRILLPIDLERWLHEVTIEPDIPEKNVRDQCIEAWRVAHDLFTAAERTITWDERIQRRRQQIAMRPFELGREFGDEDEINNGYLESIFNKKFAGLEFQMLRNEDIAPEFRVVDVNQEPIQIIQQLGRVVSDRAFNVVPKILAA